MIKIKQIENTETYLVVCTKNSNLFKLRKKEWGSSKKFFVVWTRNDISNLEQNETFWKEYKSIVEKLNEDDYRKFSENIFILKASAVKKAREDKDEDEDEDEDEENLIENPFYTKQKIKFMLKNIEFKRKQKEFEKAEKADCCFQCSGLSKQIDEELKSFGGF